MVNWGKIYCSSWWGNESNKNSIPISQFDQCGQLYSAIITQDSNPITTENGNTIIIN